MKVSPIRFVLAAFLLVATFSAVPAAGQLAGHANAIPAFTGSTPFSNGTLTGFVDYAVFLPGDFPYAGYTPTPGELTYAYQVFVTGLDPVSEFAVGLSDQADNIGSFSDLGGVPPTTSSILPLTTATWTFNSPPVGSGNIMPGQMSEGLAFSSIKLPVNGGGVVIDTGTFAIAVPLPTPGPDDIPEPAVLGLVLAVLPLVRRWRR